jgi:polyhydroxybutyrate depolymerase
MTLWNLMRFIFFLLFLSACGVTAVAGCAGDAAPCTVAGGEYEIELPRHGEPPLPAVVFIHGYASSGKETLRNRDIVDALLARGYAVIAPNGKEMQWRDGNSWTFIPEAGARDDVAFIEAVRDNAAKRFGIDKRRMLLAGFSVGGSMVSYLACAAPNAFPAYAPLSGGFWRPHPERCSGPVRLLHTHGWTDRTVPLEGRILSGHSSEDPNVIAQGDIFRTMEIWRMANDCSQLAADDFVTTGPFWRRSWTRCTPGSALELALFPGGHRIPPVWADFVLDWFEALPPRH